MNRLLAFFPVGALMMTVGSGCGGAVEGKKQESTAFRFTMQSLDGKAVDLAQYAGW